jgi:alpha-tubulin suppressor-like RCC1 family protein
VPDGLDGVVTVGLGNNFCVATTKDGRVVCWGDAEDECCNVPHDLVVKTPGYVLM